MLPVIGTPMDTTLAPHQPAKAAHPSAMVNSARGKPAEAAASGEYLTFRLGEEEYGIDILRVQEIRSYEDPTRIAGTPDFIKGVVNLRGVIVPIVDLRLKFALPRCEYNDFTVVIVLSIRSRVVGVVVDSVSDVITLRGEQLRPSPDFSSAINTEHLLAIGAVDERMLILIDIEKLMMSGEMGLMDTLPTA